MSSNKAIVLVHGHGPKPGASDLLALWRAALVAGLRRDHSDLVAGFEELPVTLSYYADAFPEIREGAYNAELDLADRKRCLQTLAQLDKPKRFRRDAYEELPGKSSLKEFLADLGAPMLRSVGLGPAMLQKFIAEFGHYWQDDSEYPQAVQAPLMNDLTTLLEQRKDVLLISHCFGSIVAYDCLWRLSHHGLDRKKGQIGTWLTLGSPLADDTVRARLLGQKRPREQRFPSNLVNWHNIAAEDDYVCHDETVANDFAALIGQRRISVLEDHLIYNLSIRFGRSNPHSSLGYLIHPKVSALVAQWLQDA